MTAIVPESLDLAHLLEKTSIFSGYEVTLVVEPAVRMFIIVLAPQDM
jgi:hypothetical protein